MGTEEDADLDIGNILLRRRALKVKDATCVIAEFMFGVIRSAIDDGEEGDGEKHKELGVLRCSCGGSDSGWWSTSQRFSRYRQEGDGVSHVPWQE